MLPDYLLSNYSVHQFVNNFLALLLCKINVLDFFLMGDFLKFLSNRNMIILMELNN